MRSDVRLESLETRRKINKAILFYKIQNNFVNFTLNLVSQSAHFPGIYTHIQFRTNAYHRSFVPESVVVWHKFSTAATSSISLEAFITNATSELIHLFYRSSTFLLNLQHFNFPDTALYTALPAHYDDGVPN